MSFSSLTQKLAIVEQLAMVEQLETLQKMVWKTPSRDEAPVGAKAARSGKKWSPGLMHGLVRHTIVQGTPT